MSENQETLIMEKGGIGNHHQQVDLDTEGNRSSISKYELCEDVDEALTKMGGFSKYQCFSFTIIVSGMAAGAFILYNLYYFEKEPAYVCSYSTGSPYVPCNSTDICSS